MRKIVFLDLEGTVIESFDDGSLVRSGVNHEPVRAFLQAERPEQTRLFSFALTDESDVRLYRNWWARWIDVALGLEIDLSDVFTTQKLQQLCESKGLYFESARDCRRFHGKSFGFQRYIELSPQFRDAELVLLDDDVEPATLHYPRRNLTLRLVNVTDLPKKPTK